MLLFCFIYTNITFSLLKIIYGVISGTFTFIGTSTDTFTSELYII